MQLFVLLHSGRNVVVHPCKSFLTGSAMGSGESNKFKNAFFQLILMNNLEVFRLVRVSRLTNFNEICQNEGMEGLLMLTKFDVAVLIFGDIRPQNMYKNNRFRPAGRHDSCINVTFGTAKGPKIPSAVPNFTSSGDIWGFPTPKHEKLPKIDKIANFFVDK